MNIFKGLITKELVFLKSYKKNLILFVILAAMLCFLNDILLCIIIEKIIKNDT